MASWIFEDEQQAEWHRLWFPERAEQTFFFRDWVAKLTRELASPAERLSEVQAWPGLEPYDPVLVLSLCEELRESLILNREQATHCFSELPNTQKNRRLALFFFRYLDSPLAEDFTNTVWDLIHALKTRSFVLAEGTWNFVPATESRFLFNETFVAAQTQSPNVTLAPFSRLGALYDSAEPSAQTGSPATVLENFAQALAGAARKRKLFVPFSATPGRRAWLKYRLANLGLSAREEKTQGIVLPYFDQWLVQLRQNSDLPLSTRLGLVSRLRRNPPRFQENAVDYRARLATRLAPEDLALLPEDSLSSATADSANETDIVFIPWMAIPRFSDSRPLAYWDESLLERPFQDSLLSEGEREMLNRAGFPVSSFARRESAFRRAARELCTDDLGPSLFFGGPGELLESWKFRAVPVAPAVLNPLPKAETKAPLSTRIFSATQLETYAECPARYWVSRLKLKKDEDFLDRYALFFGQAVHLALENLFGRKAPLTAESLKEQFAEALGATEPSIIQRGKLALLFTQAFERLIPRILTIEKTLATLFPGSERLAFEQTFQIEWSGIKLTGKIDRIDKLQDGGHLVLDYKTGSIDFTPEHLRRGENFQALLYWMAAEALYGSAPAGMLFYDLKKGELRRGLVQEECVSADVKKALTRGHVLTNEKCQSLLDSGREALAALTGRIRELDFQPTPSAEACRYCEAMSFCRKAYRYA